LLTATLAFEPLDFFLLAASAGEAANAMAAAARIASEKFIFICKPLFGLSRELKSAPEVWFPDFGKKAPR
jgi:hypothetical protein